MTKQTYMMMLMLLVVGSAAFGQAKKKAAATQPAKQVYYYQIKYLNPSDSVMTLKDRNNDAADLQRKESFTALVRVYEFCGSCYSGDILQSDYNLDNVEPNTLIEMYNISRPERYRCNIVRLDYGARRDDAFSERK